jgi:hypothetical protein
VIGSSLQIAVGVIWRGNGMVEEVVSNPLTLRFRHTNDLRDVRFAPETKGQF